MQVQKWALTRANIKQKKKTSPNQNQKHKQDRQEKQALHSFQYIQGMGDSCKNICRKHGVEMFFKGGNTIKDPLVHPKDRGSILQKSGLIYRFRCGRVNCDEEYIGESGRTFAERFREHMKAPSPIHDHHNIIHHELSLDKFSIVGRED